MYKSFRGGTVWVYWTYSLCNERISLRMDVYSQAEVFIELNMNIYYRGYETMK